MKALDGVVVLDLSRVLALPFCTQMLSDLGATVWKVESPWGDDARSWAPPFVNGESSYFLSINRGKKSLAVNLKDEQGRGLVRRLAERADVFVENFKSGDLARYGLDYPNLAEVNPRLIHASVTGFGQTGPRSREAGYDTALQGMTGIMSVTGDPEGPPMKVGVAWIDVLAGLTAAVGILAALRERERSGEGQHVDLSLFDVGLMSMINLAQSYLLTGEVPNRIGNVHAAVAPLQPFEAKDGWVILTAGNDNQYRRMCEALGHSELAEDPRFKTNANRMEHRGELVSLLAEIFRTRSSEEWIRRLNDVGVPATPIHDLAGAFADPQAKARDLVWEGTHPTIGTLPMVANALQHMSRTPAGAGPADHPPLLGEHTREVLKEALGIGETELDHLEERGAIRSKAQT